MKAANQHFSSRAGVRQGLKIRAIKKLFLQCLGVDIASVVRELSQKPRQKADISASAVLEWCLFHQFCQNGSRTFNRGHAQVPTRLKNFAYSKRIKPLLKREVNNETFFT